VPAFNEAKRFPKVINELLKIKELLELIFVDDGSSDNTEEVAKKFVQADSRFKYVKHRKNRGKGVALKTGVSKSNSEIILFLDADLENITSEKIKRIVIPVLKDEVDVARGAFRRRRGRVTEYAVKPMMQVLFPNVYFEQPISGQICAKKTFLQSVEFENRYGVDIGLLFDAIESGQRIIEVDIGRLIHKANEEDVIGEMSRQVLETMIKKAGLISHKYKLVIFTLDDTLISKKNLDLIFKKLKIFEQIQDNQKKLTKGEINYKTYLSANARLFEGLSKELIKKACNNVSLAKYAAEVISALKRRKYQVAIVSSNFSPIVESIANRLNVNITDSVELVVVGDHYTGKIAELSKLHWGTEHVEESFKVAFDRLAKKVRVKYSEIVMVAQSEKAIPLMRAAGLSVAFKPKSLELKSIVDKTISVHAELLAIIE